MSMTPLTGVVFVNSALVAFILITQLVNSPSSTGASNQKLESGNAANINYLDPKGPNVQFILFTKSYPPFNIRINVHEDLEVSGFNIKGSTKILIHGFSSSTQEDVFVSNRDAYLSVGEYNVIGVDWSVLCEFEYFTAMHGAQIAGGVVSMFINFLLDEGVEHKDIHIIGHSLGAHVAAMAAVRVKGGKVGRITGLDPAGPGYNEVKSIYRLDPNDAELVDVIHTSARVLSLSKPQGHLDFYPNGGRLQPGCPDMYQIWTIGPGMECNHARAYYYFAESIRNPNAFPTFQCNSVDDALRNNCLIESHVRMGREETYEPGIYYLQTNPEPPYSIQI